MIIWRGEPLAGSYARICRSFNYCNDLCYCLNLNILFHWETILSSISSVVGSWGSEEQERSTKYTPQLPWLHQPKVPSLLQHFSCLKICCWDINYLYTSVCSFVFMKNRFTINAAPTRSISIANQLNHTTIMKVIKSNCILHVQLICSIILKTLCFLFIRSSLIWMLV